MKYEFFKVKALCFIITLINFSFCYENKSNKYTLETQEKLSSRYSNMKIFAKNLADTSKLKVIKSNLRFGNNFYSDAKNENNFDFSDSSQTSNDILIGSILRDDNNGELSFHKAYLDNILYQNTKKVLARARYNMSLNKIGWSKLYVETFDNAAPEIISWAAGFLEGKLTAPHILDFYNNLVGIHEKESEYLNDVFKYYEKVEKYIRKKTNKKSLENIKDMKNLEYWISVAMTQAQSDGLLQGYNSRMGSKTLNFAQIYFINADGEVPELLNVFKFKSSRFDGSNYSFRERSSNKQTEVYSKAYLKEYYGSEDPEIVWQKIMANSHCSAIIRLIKDENDNPKDIMVGHTTWDSYSEMHRIFKKYSFSYTMYGDEKKKSEVMFSSYPGTLTSTDDFYVINQKFVVLETTLEMLNKGIYQSNMPDADSHVPNYIRISVANRLANSAKEWTEIFKQNNSGTYNSQWMIIDYSKFKREMNNYINDNMANSAKNNYSTNDIILNESLFDSFKKPYENKDDYKSLKNNNRLPGDFDFFNFKQMNNEDFLKNSNNNNNQFSELFFILEQVPGYVEIRDMTNYLLEKGFWGSYNRPYFEKIYKLSGYHEMMLKYGKTYSYFDNPRAVLIKYAINKVKTIEDMKNFMQMNSSPTDGSFMHAISPRYDLIENPEIRRPSGGIDSKIINTNLINGGTILAISGPSISNGVSPFSWADWQNEPHYGLPETWNFGWNYFDDTFIKN